jgi:hypothetical protein
MEQGGWFEGAAEAQVREELIHKVYLSPNARIFILQKNREKISLYIL